MASLIETCKPNAIDPYPCLRATLTAIANKHPKPRIDDLMPWDFQKTSSRNPGGPHAPLRLDGPVIPHELPDVCDRIDPGFNPGLDIWPAAG